jgi:hypothetical protein
MALMKVAGDAIAATTFAMGTALSGYMLAAVLASVVTVAGALTLLWADRMAGSNPALPKKPRSSTP